MLTTIIMINIAIIIILFVDPHSYIYTKWIYSGDWEIQNSGDL